jgi:hypothetical protein
VLRYVMTWRNHVFRAVMRLAEREQCMRPFTAWTRMSSTRSKDLAYQNAPLALAASIDACVGVQICCREVLIQHAQASVMRCLPCLLGRIFRCAVTDSQKTPTFRSVPSSICVIRTHMQPSNSQPTSHPAHHRSTHLRDPRPPLTTPLTHPPSISHESHTTSKRCITTRKPGRVILGTVTLAHVFSRPR